MNSRRTIPLPFRKRSLMNNNIWYFATLAQLVEHSPCKRTVVSSNLTGGSISFPLSIFTILQFFAHSLFSEENKVELRQTAEVTLLHQCPSGGWPKNYDRKKPFSATQSKRIPRKTITTTQPSTTERPTRKNACSPTHSSNLGTNDSRKLPFVESSTC
jgi:hypothetical protein